MATTNTARRLDYVQAVDSLGHLSAEAADLKIEIDDLKQMLRNSGEAVIEGIKWRVTIGQESQSPQIDWKAIAESFIPPTMLGALVKKHTTYSSRAGSVRVVARTGKGV